MDISRSTGGFISVWSTTDVIRNFKYAIGVAEVTSDQLTAIAADNRIIVFDEALLLTTFGSLNGAVRNKINTFLDNAGIGRPTNDEVLRDLWTRVSELVDFKSVDDLLAKLQYEIEHP